MTARRTQVELIYEGVDISADAAPYMEEFSYTDNMHGKADEISVTLNDRSGRWASDWFPQKSDRIKAAIITRNWKAEGDRARLFCGEFSVDELDFSFPPQKLKIQAVSTPVDGSLRREKKDRAWESASLSDIASELAGSAGLQMFLDVDIDVDYDRVDQRGESDLSFIQRLCEDAGLAVKVTDSRLVIFDEAEYGKKDAAMTIRKNGGVIDCSFRTQAHDTYRACRVKYYDAKVKKTLEHVYEAENISSGQVLVDNRRVNSFAQAKQRAKRLLHQKNKREVEGSVSLPGSPGLVAGMNVDMEGFGSFDGKYLITRAAHRVSGGYTTRLDVQRAEND